MAVAAEGRGRLWSCGWVGGRVAALEGGGRMVATVKRRRIAVNARQVKPHPKRR